MPAMRYCMRMLPRLVIVIAALAMLTGDATAQNGPLGVGLADIEITPPLGYRMDGYFTEDSGSAPSLAAACSLNRRARGPENIGPVCVCVAVIAMLATGIPVFCAASARTSVVSARGRPITSATTSAVFVGP